MAKISIIIPVFNTEAFLSRCLDSVTNQTLHDIEILCVNDGSTDNSLNILESYAALDPRIKIINKKNEGQSVARNTAIDLAKGEFLGFVDSDDWIDLDYFEKLYNAAKKHDCDMAAAGFKRHRGKKSKISKSYETELVCTNINDKVRLDNLPAHNYIWNKIYKKDSWVKNNIKFEAGKYYEDMALIVKILNVLGKMVTVPDVYYNYRINNSSTVAQKTLKHTSDYEWALEEMLNYSKVNNIKLDLKNVVKSKEYYKFLNITVLKIYRYYYRSEYKLFGIIPFMTKQIV